MALQTSGAISLNDMNVEANNPYHSGSNTSINDADIRGLIGKASGATMSFNEWYGASNSLETQTVNVGYQAGGTYTPSFYGTGFSGIAIMNNSLRDTGTCTDGTLAVRSNKYIVNLRYQGSGSTGQVFLQIMNDGQNITNAGFTTMNIAGTNYSRSSATFSHSTGTGAGTSAGQSSFTSWNWSSSSNPFGTTTGVNKTVTFS